MGLFGLSKSKVATFGLDIGSSAVKVVELVPGKMGYALKSFAMVDLPREAITEGSVRQPAVGLDELEVRVVGRDGARASGARSNTVLSLFVAYVSRGQVRDWIESLQRALGMPPLLDTVMGRPERWRNGSMKRLPSKAG